MNASYACTLTQMKYHFENHNSSVDSITLLEAGAELANSSFETSQHFIPFLLVTSQSNPPLTHSFYPPHRTTAFDSRYSCVV